MTRLTQSGTANGTKVQLWGCHSGGNQQWQVQGSGEQIQLVNPQSGRCLDAFDGSSADGTQLIIWDCHGGANQRWDVPDTPGAGGAVAETETNSPYTDLNYPYARFVSAQEHAEGHAAARIRQLAYGGIREATLYLNNIPCGGARGCDMTLASILPKNFGLTLHYLTPEGSVSSQLYR